MVSHTALRATLRSVMATGTLDAWDDKPKPQGSSLASVVSAFVPTWFTACAFVFLFVAIRHRYPKIYSPRTFIGTISEKDRTPSASRSYFDWLHTLMVVPDKFILHHESLDSYLFLRFLRTLIFLCVVGCCITWPILMPVNASGGGASSQLDRVSIGNVADKEKLYAHAAVAWVFFSFIMFTVARERLWLISLRQAWTLSNQNAKRLSARVVLFLSAPTAALDQENMGRYFGGDAVRLWPATEAKKLQSLVSSRDSLVEDLEAAELKLIQNANRWGSQGKSTRSSSSPSYDGLPNDLKKSLRPTHLLKTPPIGKRVDSINWYREQIKSKEAEIEEARASNQHVESHGGAAAVFVEFRTQTAAQQAYQRISSSEVLALTPRYTDVAPDDIIWDNLTLPPARRISQAAIANALVIAIIIFWSIPVSIVGAFSNVSYLAERFTWLNWLNDLPDPILGLLTGLVPPTLLSLLSTWVPDIFRYIFKAFGEPSNTYAELKVLKCYFIFQVLQVFLVNTIASGAAAVLSQVANNPSSLPELLADILPSASNSYLTYFIVQGLTSSSSNLLAHSKLLSYIFFDYALDKTPRQKYNRYTALRSLAWGKLMPKFGNFAVIAIAYSCIAPLVLGFAAVGLTIFYISYRYLCLFTARTEMDTKGQCYTLALQQLLAGTYIAELCLLGLFSLRGGTGPCIIMIILLIATVLFHITTNKYLSPLEQFLPADLAQESADNANNNNDDDDDDDPSASLLSSAEQGDGTDSRIHRFASRARFFQPRVFASHRAIKAWLRADPAFDEHDEPKYSEDELRNAYLNPAYTSRTPVVWLPNDTMGVSEIERRENEAAGLLCSHEGAWIQRHGDLAWSMTDFAKVPIFKAATKW